LPAMRIATDRPLQHTRNDRLRHWGGSLGSIPSVSLIRSKPAKPSITAAPWAPLTADARQTLTGRNPADSGDTLRRHLEHPPAVTDHLHAGVTLADPDVDLVVLCDEHQRPVALLGEHTAAQPIMKINIDTPVRDAALRAITRTDWAQPLLCTDNAGRYVGVVRMPRLLHALSTG